jgi:hypothetical protein
MKGGDREVVAQEAHAGDTVAWSALIEPPRTRMSARDGMDGKLLGCPARELLAAPHPHPPPACGS